MTKDIEKTKIQRLWIGRVLSLWGIGISIFVGLWEAWLLPIYNSYDEGDPDGCFYGMLMAPTYFLVPGLILIVFIFGLIGFRFRARTLAIIAWILAILTMIPITPGLIDFFGS